jgi:NADPH:quinone reductase-like Zn-dependent oxidoreductase
MYTQLSFGLQIAAACGANVIVISSSDEKLTIAKKLGATHTINYKTTPEWDVEVMKIARILRCSG